MWIAPPPIECDGSCSCWDCAVYRQVVMRIALGITLILGFAGSAVVGWEATHEQAPVLVVADPVPAP